MSVTNISLAPSEPKVGESELDYNAALGANLEQSIRARISHALSVYPKLSPSMLQVGIGTGISPSLWHVVLDRMESEGKVLRAQVRATNPVTNREQTYTILSLAD